MSYVELWTDGSGTSSGPAGWAAVLRWIPREGEPVKRERCGQLEDGTNNRAELTAVIEGLRALNRDGVHVIVHTDSEYVMKAFTDGWLSSWRSKGWMTGSGSKKRPVANRDLWELLEAEVARHHVEWRHVRGHTGVELNERADQLAGEQRRLAIAAVALFDAEAAAA